jgi:Plant transposon protein
VEYIRLSETLNNTSLKKFCSAVVTSLNSDYLRLPTFEELTEIEAVYARLGFPGCIGRVDVASWQWDNCPVGRQGQFKGEVKKPCCHLEVVTDDKLYIWHMMFGTPGAKNDINVMRNDDICSDKLTKFRTTATFRSYHVPSRA